MTREQITEEVQLIFRKVFHDHSIAINANTVADDIELWDSLTHLELIDEVEKKFNILFSFEEVMVFANVGKMIDTIHTKTIG